MAMHACVLLNNPHTRVVKSLASIDYASQSHSLLQRRFTVGAAEDEVLAVTVTYTVVGVHVPDKEAIVEEDIVEFEVELTLELDEEEDE